MYRYGSFFAGIFGKKTIENEEKALIFRRERFLLKGKIHTIIGV